MRGLTVAECALAGCETPTRARLTLPGAEPRALCAAHWTPIAKAWVRVRAHLARSHRTTATRVPLPVETLQALEQGAWAAVRVELAEAGLADLAELIA